MNFDTLESFFTQLFTQLSSEDSMAIIIFLVLTFLLGLLFGWWAGRSGKRKLRKALKEKESALITLQAEFDALKEKQELRDQEYKVMAEENEAFKDRIARLEDDKSALQGDLYASKDQVEKLQAESLASLSRIDALNAELVEAREQTPTVVTTTTETVGLNEEQLQEINQLQTNYSSTLDRLLAVEEKLNRLESENSGLRAEISSMKDTSAIAFLDEEPAEEDEEIEMAELNTGGDSVAFARQALNNAMGTRIPMGAMEDRDDLKQINGIGPFIEDKLNDVGIYTFEQISLLDEELTDHLTAAIQFFPGRIQRDDWVGQAKKLMET